MQPSERPQRPDFSRSEAPRSGGWLSIMLVAVLGLAIIVVLMFLTLGWIAPVLVIGGGLFAVAALNYLLWGRWLMKSLKEADEAAERAADEAAHDATRPGGPGLRDEYGNESS